MMLPPVDSLDALFEYVKFHPRSEEPDPGLASVLPSFSLENPDVIDCHVLHEDWPPLSAEQVAFLDEICRLSAFQLKPHPFCDFTCYSPHSPVTCLQWFQTKLALGFYDMFLSVPHLFRRAAVKPHDRRQVSNKRKRDWKCKLKFEIKVYN
jgi:hypothetical protein